MNNHPKDDIYIEKFTISDNSSIESFYTPTVDLSKSENDKNDMLEMSIKKDTPLCKIFQRNYNGQFPKYNFLRLQNKNGKSQQNRKFSHVLSRMRIGCNRLCSGRHSLDIDTSSEDGSCVRDRIQNAPLLLHDHGSDISKYDNQDFIGTEQGDIWTMESNFIRDSKLKNARGKRNPRHRNHYLPVMPMPIEPSLSAMSTANYEFFSNKHTQM